MLPDTDESTCLEVTETLLKGCCAASTPAVLMLPTSRSGCDVAFEEAEGTRIGFSAREEMDSSFANQSCCVHFRFDGATRLLLCRIVETAPLILVEVLSDCVARDQRAEFRVPVRDGNGLKLKVRHRTTGESLVSVEELSCHGASVKVPKSIREQWSVGDVVRFAVSLGSRQCDLEARIKRLCRKVGFELLDPETHQVPNSARLRGIVSELQRRYLKNRIRV